MLGQVRKLALVGMTAGLVACAKEPAHQGQPLAEATPSIAKAESTAPVKSAASGDAFEVKLEGPASASAAKGGELVIALTAKPGYKINAEYPHSFRPEKDSGVQFSAARFELAEGTKTACEKKPAQTCRLEAKVPFQASAQGEQRAAGIVAFSVCNEDICLIEKVPLATTVSVR